MQRAYVITGELENGEIVCFYAVCHNMKKADELCLQAESEELNPNCIYTWHEVIEEDD